MTLLFQTFRLKCMHDGCSCKTESAEEIKDTNYKNAIAVIINYAENIIIVNYCYSDCYYYYNIKLVRAYVCN